MAVEDVEITEPEPDPAPGRAGPRRRRRPAVVAGLVIGIPVLAVGALLGVRALSGADVDLEATNLRVSEFADGLLDDDAGYLVTGVGNAEQGTSGSFGSGPDAGVMDVTVVCASVHGKPAVLTVRSGGAVVGEAAAACSDAGDTGTEPAVTEVPGLRVGDGWSFDLVPETAAALAVISR